MAGSIFYDNEIKTKGFAGKESSVPLHLQFVPGFVIDVVHSPESLHHNGKGHENTIIALPKASNKLLNRIANTSETNRYFPLLRSMHDIPTKGDPVLLCEFGGQKYYLGPLNMRTNSPTWNSDINKKPERTFAAKTGGKQFTTGNRKVGESKNFNMSQDYQRLVKYRKKELDYGLTELETTGDMIFEGRHGNSLRIGSRSNNPYLFISNNRHPNNHLESLGDGSIISITSNGTLAQHFGNYSGEEFEAISRGFLLSSDTIKDPDNPPNRFMGTLVSNVNGGQDSQELIYEYGQREAGTNSNGETIIKGTKADQILLHSDRVTINTKLDDIYLSSIKDIHIGTGRHLTISTNESLIFETQKTFLGNPFLNGKDRTEKMEGIVLGKKLQDVLKDMLNLLSEVKSVSSQLGQVNLVINPETITNISTKINNMLSLNHYIEPNN